LPEFLTICLPLGGRSPCDDINDLRARDQVVQTPSVAPENERDVDQPEHDGGVIAIVAGVLFMRTGAAPAFRDWDDASACGTSLRPRGWKQMYKNNDVGFRRIGTVVALLRTPPKENLDEDDHGLHRLRAVSVRHECAGTSSARARRLGVRPAGL
jgi:hypothetical protein